MRFVRPIVFLIGLGCVTTSENERSVDKKAEMRIVGGEISPRRYPYQISLQVKESTLSEEEEIERRRGDNEYVNICGGAIISKTCVLTAAQCIDQISHEDLSILAGTNKLRGGGGKRLSVRSIKIHPNYNGYAGHGSDIAILKIIGTFKFDDKIAPIKFSNNEVAGDVESIVAGWGKTMPSLDETIPNDLQRIFLPTITNPQCKILTRTISNTQLCTYTRPIEGPCDGDIGSPLATGDGQEIIGVLTDVQSCGFFPAVYTRVSKFADWIKKIYVD